MLKIYGSPRSSAGRCLFLLEELGLAYEIQPLDMSNGGHKSADYLKLNPNGKVPCLVDGDFVLWESVAINQYLAEKHRPELCGSTAEEKARIQQWSLWGLLELQAPLVDLIVQMMFTPEAKRNAAVIERAKTRVPAVLEILDDHLRGREFIVGTKLTVADFNLATVVNIAPMMQIALDPYPSLKAWFEKMKSRPSFQKFAETRGH